MEVLGLLPRAADEDHSPGQRAMVVTSILTGMAIAVVALRFYARLSIMKSTGREDWAILTSLIFSIAYLGCVAGEYHNGLGVHSALLPSETLKTQLKCLWAAIPMYNASLGFSRFSILFQYLRIFHIMWFKHVCYILLAISATYSAWAVVSGFVNCVPIAKFWDRELPGTCLSFEAVWFFNAGMNIVQDLVLLILPMPLLSQLQLPKLQKSALIGVFAVGILVVITSVLRLSSLLSVAQSPDVSYTNVAAAYWTAAECNVAIICACLPFLRPIISHISPKMLLSNGYIKRSKRATTNNNTVTYATHRSERRNSQLFAEAARNKDLDLYFLETKPEQRSPSSLGGIEVTTEMHIMRETLDGDGNSERALVIKR